jgi:hypothetical protein
MVSKGDQFRDSEDSGPLIGDSELNPCLELRVVLKNFLHISAEGAVG